MSVTPFAIQASIGAVALAVVVSERWHVLATHVG
jgi:hypothetical protein